MDCGCTYAFFVDGVPVHCTGEHSHQNGSTMHRLPALPLTAGSMIETYKRTPLCINCKEAKPDGNSDSGT